MIKFIATDLDGTLLDEAGALPAEIFPLIGQLHQKGVLFAPASGRQYANLAKLFAPAADRAVFICENGALVKYRGETLYLLPIENDCLKSALDAIRSLPHLYPMLCGVNSAYIEDRAEPFYSYSVAAYTNCKLVEDLDGVIGREPICKIAVFDEISAAENCMKVLPQRLPELRTMISGTDWCDVSAPGANKGAAIRFLQQHFGLAKEECVAFGDHMNDYEMLVECGTAYVTENCYPPLKKLVGHTVPSNAAGGVLAKLREILSSPL